MKRAQWLTSSEAAAALGISERTVQRRAASGKLTARKVTTGDGEKWEIQLSADSDAKAVPTGDATQSALPSAPMASNTGERADSAAKVTPESADSDATSETVFLRAQLEAMNEALKREQSAHEQTRQLLAGALQMASRQLPNVTPQSAPEPQDRAQSAKVDRDSSTDARGARRGANRQGYGSILKRFRENVKGLIK